MQVAPLRALIALVLVVLTVVSGGCERLRPERKATDVGETAMTVPSAGTLKEVAPPGAVLQLQERLTTRNPQLAITAPADDALLPDGPWTLKLRVSDWPLSGSDSGELGPYLVVQLDQQSPKRISAGGSELAIPMEPLAPGSHRLTVYAARPWGEAVKAPGAFRQIRLHRAGRNDAELPARNTAQLIVASPDGRTQQEPVLIDWLLLDAPLQNLRDDDARWRLRVSVNGDSFLVDRQTPLWLQGFRRGSNAVQLELLDARGEPLNAPFNSIVREVVVGGSERPAWLRPSLSAAELARLSGEAPPPETAPEPEPERTADAEPEPQRERALPPLASVPPPESAVTDPAAPSEPAVQPEMAAQREEPLPKPDPEREPEPAPENNTPALRTRTPEAQAGMALPGIAAHSEPEPQTEEAREAGEAPAAPPPPAPANDRISAGSSLGGSARDQVSADGSLLKPQRRGPLAGLREKLGA